MNILLTGGAGYIGSHVCVELLEAGHEVLIFDNLSNSSKIVLNRIEQITGKPVVTSNQAMIWHTMRACDDNSTNGPGMLFNH